MRQIIIPRCCEACYHNINIRPYAFLTLKCFYIFSTNGIASSFFYDYIEHLILCMGKASTEKLPIGGGKNKSGPENSQAGCKGVTLSPGRLGPDIQYQGKKNTLLIGPPHMLPGEPSTFL